MNLEDDTLAVIDALNAEGVAWMLVGSYSSNYYGIPRSTQDADFVVHLEDKSITCLRNQLGPRFKLDPQISFETVTGTLRNVIELEDSPFKIELFRLSKDAHDQTRFSRRITIEILGRKMYLPTAEDVIVMKLRWMRAKDREDIVNVLAVQGDNLDFDHIHRWCDQHGTRAALDEIRQEVPEI